MIEIKPEAGVGFERLFASLKNWNIILHVVANHPKDFKQQNTMNKLYRCFLNNTIWTPWIHLLMDFFFFFFFQQ